jgi:1-deoxy-D-xylulose-5-phosphate synthase
VFEELGLRYIGPVDGHDIPSLVRVLRAARRMRRRVVVHVLTQKGHGYPPAESAPEHFHGLGSFDPEAPHFVDSNHSAGGAVTFSDQLGTSLLSLMAADDRVVAITAGMCHGTGLVAIRERFPERFFDVGIAEEHAVVFAAGLAAAGLRPIVAMYATFMQRAMDYVYHDVCLQKLPVIFCLDRAGVVADGPTHHGILDLGFWLGVPGLAVLQPADATEQDAMLAMALEQGVPTLIRYPRGKATAVRAQPALQWGRSAELRTGTAATIWALGREVQTAFETADLLASRGIDVGVTNVRFLTPFDREALLADARERPVVTLEDHVECAGLGLLAAATLQPLGQARLLARGYPREIVPFGTVEQIRRQYRLDPESLAEDIGRFVQGQTSTTAPIRQEASTPTTDTSADIPADRLQQ